MTSILTAAVCVLAVLVVLNLALTLAIVRRLRAGTGRPVAEVIGGPTVGTDMPALELTASDGAVVHTASAGLIAFAADGCTPCHEQIPELREAIESRLTRGEQALVVVLTPAGPTDDFVAAFDGLAPVVLDDGERIAHAFDIDGYPTYVESAAGVIDRVSGRAADLRGTARV